VQIEVFAYYADSSGSSSLGYGYESSAARSEKYQVKFGHVYVYDVRMISALCRESTLNHFVKNQPAGARCPSALKENSQFR